MLGLRRGFTLLLFLICPVLVAQDREPPAGTTSGFVKVEGAKLFYEETGTGDALVLIHGGLLDLTMWDPQVAQLAKRYRVVRYDVRGHGKTESEPAGYSHVDDLEILLKKLKIKRLSLVGLSMGSGAATQFAIANPKRVSSLVLVSPGFDDGTPPSAELSAGEDKLESTFFTSAEEFVEAFMAMWLDGPQRNPSVVPSEIRDHVRTMATGARGQFALQRNPRPLDPPGNHRLKEINAPTLVVTGDLDMPDVQLAAPKIAQMIDGAEEVVIEGTAHLLTLERPAEFNSLLETFLSRSQQ